MKLTLMPPFFLSPSISMSIHPDDNTLRLFVSGQLDDEFESQVESHLAECPACLERLSTLERFEPGALLQEMKVAGLAEDHEKWDSGFEINSNHFNDNLAPGDRLNDHFRLEEILGHGGMGVAWKAYDEIAERFVVLKFVPKDIQNMAEAMNSVRESFSKVHALQHSHICPLYGLFNDPKHGFYLAMKFIDGWTLDIYQNRSIEQEGTFLSDEIIQILESIAGALDYAHSQKVIHRDIKPQNIMLSRTDGIQIIDFGLADDILATRSQTVDVVAAKITGTRTYMAPEQWEGKRQDARTDQYALAVTAYELLAGYVPFHGMDTEILRNSVLHDQPKPISEMPDYVNAALFKALSKNRKDRFENCMAFVEALKRDKTDSKNKRKNVFLLFAFVLIFISILLVLTLSRVMQTNDKNAAMDVVNPIATIQPTIETPPTIEQKTTQGNDDSNTPFTLSEIKDLLSMLSDYEKSPFDESVLTQNLQSRKSSIPLAVPARIAEPLMSVVRMTLEVDKKGKGRYTVQKGTTGDSPLGFQGIPFPSSAFPLAQTYRGENGVGRIFFDFRVINQENIWNESEQPHGWLTTIYNANRRNFERIWFQTRRQGMGKDGYISIGRGVLPCRICVEIQDREGPLPNIELRFIKYAQGMAEINTVRGWGYSMQDGRLSVEGGFTHPQNEDQLFYFAHQNIINSSETFSKEFQLSSDILDGVNVVEQGITGNEGLPHLGNGFGLITLDVLGHFGGSTGLSVEDCEGKPVIQTIAFDPKHPDNLYSSAKRAGLMEGDEIVLINGQKCSTNEIQKILDNLNFGDPVEIKILRQSETKTFHFYAE